MNDTKMMRLIRRHKDLTLVKGEDGNYYITLKSGKAYQINEKSTYLNINRLKEEIGYKKPDKTPQKKRGVIDLGGDYDD